jgi:hypothetical protein
MSRWTRRALATLPGFLACGLTLWPLSYREVSLGARPAPGVWMLLAALAALVAFRILGGGFRWSVAAVLAGFALAVMARVIVETAADPTTHNLFPFEVAYTVVIAFPGAALGALVPSLVSRRARP